MSKKDCSVKDAFREWKKKMFYNFSFRRIMFARSFESLLKKKYKYFSIFSYFAAWSIPWQSANENPTTLRNVDRREKKIIKYFCVDTLALYWQRFFINLSLVLAFLLLCSTTRSSLAPFSFRCLENRNRKKEKSHLWLKKIHVICGLKGRKEWRERNESVRKVRKTEDNGGEKKKKLWKSHCSDWYSHSSE